MLVFMAAAQPHRLAEIMESHGISDRQLGLVLASIDGKQAETWRIRALRYRHGTKMTPAVADLFSRALTEATGTLVTPSQLLVRENPHQAAPGAQTDAQELLGRVGAMEESIQELRTDLRNLLDEIRRSRRGGPEATTQHHQVASEFE